jgi:zinc transporter ZupT
VAFNTAILHGLPFALLIGLATGAATAFGGVFALRFKSALGLLLGFSSGAVIGVALLDLLPEAMEVGGSHFRPLTLTTAVAVGFAAYLVADRGGAALAGEPSPQKRHLGRHRGPASLTVHSLMDGLGIGLAFQFSSMAGLIVAAAVLAHDLCDGANTVILSLGAGSSPRTAKQWLVADALAPLAGIVVAQLIAVPSPILALLMALFAGFFLYVGASELLPKSHQDRPRRSTIAATLMGLGFIYAVVRMTSGGG